MMEVRNSGAESQSLDRSQLIQKIDADSSNLAGAPTSVVAGSEGVRAVVGNAGDGAQVAKKKRGRPPRVQANPPVAKKSKEEDEDEDVCFICFDGGSLVLCDRRGCPKAYHPACIKRDEAFFRSKAKWNCGWHICSICEKTAHHMCYTCTYSLCKGCIKNSDYVCVRDKGFCTICMKTIMLIENSGQGKDETAKVDFDDRTSWEYLFKVYWVYMKAKLSLTFDELTQAKNPWKNSCTIVSVGPSTGLHIRPNGLRSITAITSNMSFGNLEANESKRRKTNEEVNGPDKESINTEKVVIMTDESLPCKEWASKELLDFVGHMKNGDTSMLSQFDVQALLLEYIKRNNLRKKNQIECDLRLKNLFGKPRVGHIEMLKLLEFHFLGEKKQDEADSNRDNNNNNNSNNILVVGKEKERRSHRKSEQRAPQNKLDEFAAIDVHNMNLIYLRRNLVEKLVENRETFQDKVVGSIVQIRISGSDQEHDMYRLVQVIGTSKVDVPYKIGDKLIDIMLEVLNLDKKEAVPIDSISNQELSEDDCRRLRESVRCGLVRCFTVGEIQEKAIALQSVLLDDRMETEMTRLNEFRDRASEKGQKKGVRECVQKLKLLKRPGERERRLREIPEVHSDPKMNPDYESDDTEEYFNNEHGEHVKPKYPWVSGTNTISPQKRAESLMDQPKNLTVPTDPNLEEGSSNAISNTGKDAIGSSSLARPQNEVDCDGPPITKQDQAPSTKQDQAPSTKQDQGPPIKQDQAPSTKQDQAPSTKQDQVPPTKQDQVPFTKQEQVPSIGDVVWHYRDPNGNIQGPFSMVQLQKWNQSGYFPADMKIWANREGDSALLNNLLQQQFNNYDLRFTENVTSDNKIGNQIESVDVCSPIPSSTILVMPYALNCVNLEKLPDGHGSSGQPSGQNWNRNPPSVANNLPKQFDARPDTDINRHVSPVFTAHEDEKLRNAPSKLLGQDSGNPPSWSTALSLVVGGAQLPEPADEWAGYGTGTVKREPWDSGPGPGPDREPSMKPLEVLGVGDHVAAPIPPTTTIEPSWHGLGETIEFSTLAEESVSDLLAEVDAIESRNGVPSPTSRRNSFLEDLFNGSIDEFSPTTDPGGSRSDGFSSTASDIQLHMAAGNNVFDLVKRSTGLQFPFGGQTTSSDHIGFKWGRDGAAEIPSSRQDMIDLNDSTKAEADDGERETRVSDDRDPGLTLTGGQPAGRNLVDEEEEEGEFIQPPPPLTLPPPPPPPPLTMGFDPVDSRRAVPETIQKKTERSSTGRVGGSRSGNTGRERESHHRRSSGERYNSSSNSPRERAPAHHVEDSGHGRSSRASWGRQSSFGSGGGTGGGSGYARAPPKGQRVCKFYESGRCKKGSTCNYLHP